MNDQEKLRLQSLYGSIKTHITQDEFCSFFLGKARRVKLGIDPTFHEIHLGHASTLERLRCLQELGHTVVIVIGSFTALVGDPSGKSATRPLLTKEQVDANMRTYRQQLERVLLAAKTEYLCNDRWLDKKLGEWLPPLQNVTVSQLLQRDDFKKRLRHNDAISIAEIIYPILQGYDSVAIEAEVEFGGNDQWFNLMFGRQMQKIMGQNNQQIAISCPLITGIDGRKMSKSYKNYISLNDTNMFGKIMSLSDKIVVELVHNLIFTDARSLGQILKRNAGKEAARAKAKIASYLVERYQGADSAKRQEDNFYAVDKVTKQHVTEQNLTIVQTIKCIYPDYSNSHIKRLLQQNAISISDKIITNPQFIVKTNQEGLTIRVGRKDTIIVSQHE